MNSLFRIPLLSIGLGALALASLFFILKPESFDLSGFSSGSIVLACLLTLLSYLAGGLRLKLLAHFSQEPLSLFNSIKAHLLGLFSASVTPSGSGHAPMIALSLNKQNISSAKAWSIAIYSNVIDLLCYGWMLPIALLLVFARLKESFSLPLVSLALLSTFGLLGLFYVLSFRLKLLAQLARLIFSWPFLKRWYKPAQRFIQKLTGNMSLLATQNLLHHLLLQLISAIMHLSSFALLFVCLRGVGVNVPFVSTVALTFLVLLFSFVVPTPGGSGYTEAAASLIVGYQYDMALILPAVFMWRLFSHYINFVLGPLFGGLALLKALKSST